MAAISGSVPRGCRKSYTADRPGTTMSWTTAPSMSKDFQDAAMTSLSFAPPRNLLLIDQFTSWNGWWQSSPGRWQWQICFPHLWISLHLHFLLLLLPLASSLPYYNLKRGTKCCMQKLRSLTKQTGKNPFKPTVGHFFSWQKGEVCRTFWFHNQTKNKQNHHWQRWSAERENSITHLASLLRLFKHLCSMSTFKRNVFH